MDDAQQERLRKLSDRLAGCRTYPNLEAFYLEDEQRRFSPEWDYGVMWRASPEQEFPLWRVSWVVETGDLYANETGPKNRVVLLGNVPRVGEYPYGQARGFDAWRRFKEKQPVEKVMEGWAIIELPMARTLGWVLNQLPRPERPSERVMREMQEEEQGT